MGDTSQDEQQQAPPVIKISVGATGTQTGADRQCVECRRLKRKCDRVHPCNQCKRYDKTCVFPEAENPRRGKKYLAEVKERVAKLERLLAEHAPQVSLDDLGGPLSPSADVKQEDDDLPHKPPHGSKDTPGGSGSVDQGGSLTSSPVSRFQDYRPPPTPPSTAKPRPERKPETLQPKQGKPISTVDAAEKQPKKASGYEWNERVSAAENDGTACLSVEPNGEGYLGFAAGATLLRILQGAAGRHGGLALSVSPRSEPEPPMGWAPTHVETQRYVDAYFRHYHSQYPIVHEATFRAQLAEVIPQPPLAQWALLMNTVIGLGAFCAGAPMYAVDYFLEQATSVISVDLLETGSLVLVQAYTLLSNLAQKRNKPNAGSTYLGIAVRMAIGLGLHRELPQWNIPPFEREVRRRVWWVLFIFDAGAAITFGRPILLPYGEADVLGVCNVQDRDFTRKSVAPPDPTRNATVYTSLVWQSSFCTIGNRCYDRVIASPSPTAEECLELDQELRQWHAKVPQWMTRTATMDMFDDTPWVYFSAHKLYWRFCNLRIILHRRPFLDRALKGLPIADMSSPSTLDQGLAMECLQASLDTIADIHMFMLAGEHNRLEVWYALHFLFQACFVPLIAMWTDPHSAERVIWADKVREARDTMARCQNDPLAERCMAILDQVTPSDATPDATQIQDIFSANLWQGTEFPGELIPFADLATIMSVWPANV